ncbi:Uncharacterized conserved protein [Phaffia rhodozyma]|uniref:Uncharacterized conserved protein n=1 Tax=Phaffia rhodozyma TaxID=264483 RepID=A0A0F7SLD6_PHARH|nr:Uncharacterized conserved protein [Phaffia rhodozyma]
MASTQAVPSPIRTRQASVVIQGLATEIVVEAFMDRVLILVTQLGKIGSLTQASLPSTVSLPPTGLSTPTGLLPALPQPHPATTLLPLMGTAPTADLQPVYEMYVSQLAAIVWDDEQRDNGPGGGGGKRPVVVGLGFKPSSLSGSDRPDWERERERFGKVMELVKECRVW